MSEPKTYYDVNGREVEMASPNVAAAMVARGELFERTPQPENKLRPDEYVTALIVEQDGKQRAVTSPAVHAGEVEPSPDDTQDVAVVPTGKARRKSKGDSGVL
jgi:hypothetical protein